MRGGGGEAACARRGLMRGARGQEGSPPPETRTAGSNMLPPRRDSGTMKRRWREIAENGVWEGGIVCPLLAKKQAGTKWKNHHRKGGGRV